MQILAIDLGTDMVPALGLGVEPPEEGVMDRPPRRLSDRLLNRQLLIKAFVWYGLIEAALAMGAFFPNYWVNQGNLNHLASSGPSLSRGNHYDLRVLLSLPKLVWL